MERFRTHEWLLHFLRVVPGEAVDDRRDTLSPPDWSELIDESDRCGAAPLLYHRLKTLHSDVPVPASAMARLRHLYLYSAGSGLHLYHELGKVLGLLRAVGIPVIVLKGAHLAERVYGNIALRPMSDVDVLVHKDDVMRADTALLGMGCAPTERRRRIGTTNCHFTYRLPHGELPVEVHWDVLPSLYRFSIDMDGLWDRSSPALVAGVEVSVLCPEDLLLYLCVHASKHQLAIGLKPLNDIVETIRCFGSGIDWSQVQARSQQWGVAKCVYLTFRLARELSGASVPDDLMKAIRPVDFDERFMLPARESVAACGQWSADGMSLSPNIAQLWGGTGLLQKGVRVLRRACPPPEELARTYSVPADSARIYLYYAVRMKDLLLRHGRQVWRLLRGNAGMRSLAKQENDVGDLTAWLMSP